MKALGIELESDQAVAVVDLNLQHLKHFEAVHPGYFCFGVVTHVAHIQGQHVIHSLPVARKLQDYVLSPVYFFNLTTESFYPGGVGYPYLANCSSQVQRDQITECAGINQKKNWPLVVHLGGQR
ncbi:MAG: hypothetical protein QOG55_697 [Acidobacteriaceae bacterium]|nr:hypothetical protein [Acidobacteriaceae bacterium]